MTWLAENWMWLVGLALLWRIGSVIRDGLFEMRRLHSEEAKESRAGLAYQLNRHAEQLVRLFESSSALVWSIDRLRARRPRGSTESFLESLPGDQGDASDE